MTTRLALLLVGAFAVSHIGCDAKPATSQGPQATQIQPLLWSITKDGKSSHLLGTMHSGVDPGRLPASVWQTIEGARAIAVETDQAAAVGLVARTDGTNLRDELGAAHWRKLETVLGDGTAANLRLVKTWAAAGVVALSTLPRTASMDAMVVTRARAANKPIVYLETVETQIAVLEKWLDVRELKNMLDDFAMITETNQQMLAAYLAGDEEKIVAVHARERARWLARGRTDADYDQALEDILYRRNASWIDAIEKLHADGGGFIAVGALHLCGPRSVPELLRARGYNVTRITR